MLKEIGRKQKSKKFHISTTQLATAEKTAINELPLIYESIQNENETSFSIISKDLFFEENDKRVAKLSFNDTELLKQFKDKRTSENIEHLHKHLIDEVYKRYYLKKTKEKKKRNIVITIKDSELKELLKMQRIEEVIAFMDKFTKYIQNCEVSAYFNKSKKETTKKSVKIPKFFCGNNIDAQIQEVKAEKRVRIKNREWTFTINPLYCWKDYLHDYISLPPYFSTYKGLKWNIIDAIFRQIRIRKSIYLTLPIRELIGTSGILRSESNQRNRKKRIIEPIIKAIQEINADANNEDIKIDTSTIINLAYDAFLNTKVEIKTMGICAEMLNQTIKQLRESAEEKAKKAKSVSGNLLTC